MSENENTPSPNRLRAAWASHRRGHADAQPTSDEGHAGEIDPVEIAHSRIESASEPYVSPGLRVAAAWSWRSIVVLVAIGVAFWLLAKVWHVLLPVLIALLLTALLAPLTGWMTKKGMPRVLATIIAFFGFIIVVAGLFTLVGQQIYSGMPDLVGQVMTGFSSISSWLAHNPFGLDSTTISGYIDDGVKSATDFLQNNSSQLLGGAWEATSSVGSFLAGLLLCLFTTFFFLYDGKRIFRWVMNLLPVPAQPVAIGAAQRGWTTLTQYVRVQILVAAVDAIGIGIGAAILGIPLVIPLTLLVFLASFIPIVGAIASGVVAVVVALVSNGFVAALIMLAVVIGVQQLEGHVLQPFLMGKAVSVHPLAVVLAVAAGGFLYGIVGALFAVPAVAVINTVVSYIVHANGPRGGGPLDEAEPDTEAEAVLETAKDKLAEAIDDAGADHSAAHAAGGDSSSADGAGDSAGANAAGDSADAAGAKGVQPPGASGTSGTGTSGDSDTPKESDAPEGKEPPQGR
ncbi:hypothetical protein KACC15558_02200 [Brevibacterium ammoniilyticum]|uniref:AI-2E family transporter n=1 Tax=Brevibacterium ammoniilyticum TaxID=1046555 RepID=A0ABP9TVN2_9MICO